MLPTGNVLSYSYPAGGDVRFCDAVEGLQSVDARFRLDQESQSPYRQQVTNRTVLK